MVCLSCFLSCAQLSPFTHCGRPREGMNDTVDVKMKRFALVVDIRNGVRDMAIAARNLALLSDPAQMQPEWQR